MSDSYILFHKATFQMEIIQKTEILLLSTFDEEKNELKISLQSRIL